MKRNVENTIRPEVAKAEDDNNYIEFLGLLGTGVVDYGGGKSGALASYAKYLFPNWPIKKFAEPFAGGGSVSLMVAQLFEPESLWLNDADPSMYALWVAVHEYPTELIDKISKMKPAKNTWHEFKKVLTATKKVPDTKKEIMDLAVMRVYSHTLAYKGYGPCAGGPLGDVERVWKPAIWRRLEKVHQILANVKEVKITCLDFRDVLDGLDADVVAYIDPPYFKRGKKLYLPLFEDENHEKLADRLKDAKYQWFLSYGDDPEVDDMYGEWATIKKVNVTYNHNKDTVKTFERVITPPEFPKDVKFGGRDFQLFAERGPMAESTRRREGDLDRINAFKNHLRDDREFHLAIVITEDDEVIDGRNRFLASMLAGLTLEDMLIKRVSSDVDRNVLRLTLQGTHKGMSPMEKGRQVYELQKKCDWSFEEIEEVTGIPSSTACRTSKKYEKSIAGDDEQQKEENGGLVKVSNGSTFFVRSEQKVRIEKIAANVFGGKRGFWKFAGILASDLMESGVDIDAYQPPDDLKEQVLEAVQKYLGLEDGPNLGLATVPVRIGPSREQLLETAELFCDLLPTSRRAA